MQLIQNEDHYKYVVEEGILLAKKSIWIATANLKDMQIAMCNKKYKSIATYLNELAERGIEIKLLHGGDPSKNFIKSLSLNNIEPNFKFKQCPRNHFKTVIIDNKYMYLGSANLTGAGIGTKNPKKRNFELGFITKDKKVIDEVQSLFNLIWENELCNDCLQKRYCHK